VAAEPGGQAWPGSKTLTSNIKETVEVKQMPTSFIKKLKAVGVGAIRWIARATQRVAPTAIIPGDFANGWYL
jgi:hypothetical protein